LSYENAHKHWPAGWNAHDPSTGKPHWFGEPGWAWSATILPFLEQNQIAQTMVHRDLPIADEENDLARVAPIAVFRCPSDIGPSTFVLQGGGPYLGSGAFKPLDMAASNYVGVFGTTDMHDVCEDGDCAGNGTFFLNTSVRVKDMTDGLSHTFVVGERVSGEAVATWVGVVSGGQHAPARVVGVAEDPPGSESEPEGHFHSFSSSHPEGVHFLCADGSVHMGDKMIDSDLYRGLCTRDGGESVDQFFTGK